MKPAVIEGGKKHVEKMELKTHDVDTVRYVEKKLADKGVARMERHPSDGLPLKHDPKKGTWEGPEKEFDVDAPAAAIDERDPNYVEEEVEEESEMMVAGDGVARIEVDPQLN